MLNVHTAKTKAHASTAQVFDGCCYYNGFLPGERLSEEEVSELLQGMEDSQGNVNYEGKCFPALWNTSAFFQ